jgi:MFS family permease
MPSMLHDHALWRLSIGSVLVCVAQLSLVGFVVLFLHDVRGLAASEAALVLAASQLLAAVLRISFGVWSDRRHSRVVPLRGIAIVLGLSVLAVSGSIDAQLVVLLPMLVLATGVSMGWNSLSFAAAAEIGGSTRSGAAIGIQQTLLAAAAVAVPVAFSATVEATSWRVAFFAAAAFPLLGWRVLRRLAE